MLHLVLWCVLRIVMHHNQDMIPRENGDVVLEAYASDTL